jgi:hypothetical protein
VSANDSRGLTPGARLGFKTAMRLVVVAVLTGALGAASAGFGAADRSAAYLG